MPNNSLVDVETFNVSGLGILNNQNAFVFNSNKEYQNFQNTIAHNLGLTVRFDSVPRFIARDSLVVNTFDASVQPFYDLTVNKQANVNTAYTIQELMYNVDKKGESYIKRFMTGMIGELGAKIEKDVAESCLTPFRYYGDGIAPINSHGALAKALARYRDFGAPNKRLHGYLPVTAIPDIIASGLQEFALKRNDKEAHSWELGDFDTTDWFRTNNLPLHQSGDVGENGLTVTFVSINGAGDQITFSGAAPSTLAFVENDLITFQSPTLRYLTYVGHNPTGQPVQVRVTADATSDVNGDVVVNITPSLSVIEGREQNLTRALNTTDTAISPPTHRRGMICDPDALFLAMPRLIDEQPYHTSSITDPDTGVSLRMYSGAKFAQNEHGTVCDTIWGWKFVDIYGISVLFPINQN